MPERTFGEQLIVPQEIIVPVLDKYFDATWKIDEQKAYY